MADSFVKRTRTIFRKEDYPRDPIGKIVTVNDDGTYETLLESRTTVNLVNSSTDNLYVGAVVKLVRRTKRGTLEIVGRSARKWVEPTVYYG